MAYTEDVPLRCLDDEREARAVYRLFPSAPTTSSAPSSATSRKPVPNLDNLQKGRSMSQDAFAPRTKPKRIEPRRLRSERPDSYHRDRSAGQQREMRHSPALGRSPLINRADDGKFYKPRTSTESYHGRSSSAPMDMLMSKLRRPNLPMAQHSSPDLVLRPVDPAQAAIWSGQSNKQVDAEKPLPPPPKESEPPVHTAQTVSCTKVTHRRAPTQTSVTVSIISPPASKFRQLAQQVVAKQHIQPTRPFGSSDSTNAKMGSPVISMKQDALTNKAMSLTSSASVETLKPATYIARKASPDADAVVEQAKRWRESLPSNEAVLVAFSDEQYQQALETLADASIQKEVLFTRHASLRAERQKLANSIMETLRNKQPGSDYANILLDQHMSLAAVSSSMDVCIAKIKSLSSRSEKAVEILKVQASQRRSDSALSKRCSVLSTSSRLSTHSPKSTAGLFSSTTASPSPLEGGINAQNLSTPVKRLSITIPKVVRPEVPEPVHSQSIAHVIADIEEEDEDEEDEPRRVNIKGAKAARILGLDAETMENRPRQLSAATSATRSPSASPASLDTSRPSSAEDRRASLVDSVRRERALPALPPPDKVLPQVPTPSKPSAKASSDASQTASSSSVPAKVAEKRSNTTEHRKSFGVLARSARPILVYTPQPPISVRFSHIGKPNCEALEDLLTSSSKSSRTSSTLPPKTGLSSSSEDDLSASSAGEQYLKTPKTPMTDKMPDLPGCCSPDPFLSPDPYRESMQTIHVHVSNSIYGSRGHRLSRVDDGYNEDDWLEYYAQGA